MKKPLLVLCIFMILAGNIYAGNLYSGGSGTVADPYQISTETDLYNVRNNLSSYFILMNDIDLGEGVYYADPGWTPIGPTFRGNFDGNGHIIKNLKINRPASNFQGLFAELSGATITKLGIKNADVRGASSTGILGAYSQNSTIDQCMTSGSVSSTDANCGGLLGYMDNGTVSNSYSVASVSAKGELGSYAGGLIGVVNGVRITNCYASGSILLSLPPVGGLAANGSSTITNCFWNTETQGVATSAGGTGISSAVMRTESTFTNVGWSNTIWKLDPLVNNGFPYLIWDSTPPPSIPIATAAASVTQTSFNANWNASIGATGYYLDVATDNGFTSILTGFSNKNVGNVTVYSVPGLSALTTYYFRVRAYNASSPSASSNTITVQTLPTEPAATPIATAATFVGNTSFSVNWNASARASSYFLDVATDVAFTSMAAGFNNKEVGNVTTYTVTGLTAGTTYFYRVRAFSTGSAISSSNSNTITVSTVPPVPVAISATSITQTTLSVNWNASVGATGYYLDVAIDNGFTSMVTGFSNKNVGNVTTYSVTGLSANTTYYYRVSAYNTGGASSSSNIIMVTTSLNAPSTPVAVNATVIKQTSFNLNWNALVGATGYFIDVATDNTFSSFVAGYNNKDAGNVTTYALSGLTAGTTYYYRVRAYNTGGASINSNIVSVVTLPLAPNAPVAIAPTLIKQTSFNLNWNAITGTDGYFIDVATDNAFTSFVSGYSNKDAGNVTTYTLSGLTAGTTYYYRVRAYNSGGISTNSNIISVVTLPLAPNTPVALAASFITQTSFSLNWNVLTGTDGYFIDVATDNTFTSFVSGYNNKDAGNVTTYALSGLTAGTTYYYRVRAYNSGGTSTNSNIVSVVTLPLAPNAPVATAPTLIKQVSFNLNWNALSGTDGYFIDVATDNAFTSFVSGYNNKDAGNVTTYTLSGLTAGTTYYYRVRAYNSGGISTNSNIISVVTLPLAPNTPIATAPTLIKQTSFNLNWNALVGATGYFIDVATDNTFSSFVAGYNNKDAGNVTTYALSGLTAGTTYYYRVRAYNTGGASINSNIVSVVTLPLAPNAPVAIAPTLIKQTSFNLNWNAITGTDGYFIDVATDNAFTSFVSGYSNKDAGNVTTYTLSGLTAGTTYYYRVRAYNAGGVSTNSNIISVVTLPLAPNTPVALAASLITQTSFNLNWNALVGATGYFIDVATDNTFTSFVSGYNNKDIGNVTTYTLNGLTAGTIYYYRVRAYNPGGVSNNSIIISLITLPLAPNAPVATAATLIKQTSFNLNWNPLASATGYYVDAATDSTFITFVSGYNNKDVGNVTTITLSGLTENTKYYYRVRGYNSGGTGVNSNIIVTTTLQIVSNAPIARPASSVTQTSFVANWNLVPDVIGYYIDVASDNAFNSILPAYNNKNVGNVTSVQVTGLSFGVTYYYRLRAYNTGGTSVNSIIITITTIPTVPDIPVATFATLVGAASFTANWNPSKNATGYYIDVAKDILFTTYVPGYSLKDVGNVLTTPVTGLTAGTTYYFRVVGYNASAIGQYSNVITISLKTTGIDLIAGMPTIFKLNQNYPNPFNPTTKIRFEIPSDSFVRLKVYDAVGKEVKQLANEQKSAGIYEFNFIATGLPSGIYIFRLEANNKDKNFSETRKMILMK